ncbi:hypothetical protein X777_04446 [Ooceraea biroi]|uniref:Uncharacterized protein n=1 Tax=Ooceraea biroi TaxID=2015173 RepID=A0A026WGA2_OOCBI|nr:hypothetical protein X777_04446 [Ooceraea biroi]
MKRTIVASTTEERKQPLKTGGNGPSIGYDRRCEHTYVVYRVNGFARRDSFTHTCTHIHTYTCLHTPRT